MANLHLVTGYAGNGHVSAADVGSFNVVALRNGDFVLPRGNRFSASIISNNIIRISDGDILMQGRHIRLNEGLTVDVVIENGNQGYKRNDIIAVRYTRDNASAIEEANLVVIKGTPTEGEPSDPAHEIGNIVEQNDNVSDMPLYRVPINGLNVGNLVPLFDLYCKTNHFEASVTTGWIQSGSYWYREISVPGLRESDVPIVDIKTGTDNDANLVYTENISKIIRIEVFDGRIKLWSTHKITTSFPIVLRVVRE